MAQEQRRLAAILTADVVGFSRLMEADEAGTLRRLKALRHDLVDPCLETHSGRIVKLMGDGVLVEFASVVDAVRCAVSIQSAMGNAEPDRPEDHRIKLRIGVNLGDIIVDGEDIYGDGVNVAARLQSLANPGGVAISGTVHEHIAGKLDLDFEDFGAHIVKNIERPVRVYCTGMAGERKMTAPVAGRIAEPARHEKISIAILPFDNMSGDPEQGYFSDGITEDIITELSRFRELLVISRNSSFQFRDKAIDVKDVGRKLGVQYIVEGSVRKAGNRIRVTVQLIDAASAAHIWAERYDRDLTDVFEIQDEITRTITARVAGVTRSTAADRKKTQPTESLSAYDCYLRARAYFQSDVTALQAEPYLRKAIGLDPGFSDAYALLSALHTIKYFHDKGIENLEEALALARKALDIDSAGPGANHAMGFALTFLRRLDEAGHYYNRSITLNPNEVFFRGDYANWMHYMGDTTGALREIEEAQRRDPYAHDWFWNVRGQIETVAGRFLDALRSFHRMKSTPPWAYCYMAVCHAELGHFAEARACLREHREANPGRAPSDSWSVDIYANADTANRLHDALRRAEAAEGPE